MSNDETTIERAQSGRRRRYTAQSKRALLDEGAGPGNRQGSAKLSASSSALVSAGSGCFKHRTSVCQNRFQLG